MKELQKILKEIDELITEYMDGDVPLGMQDFCAGMKKSQEIICNHMNDGWISVESELPKTNGTYNVTRYIDGHFISDSAYFDGQNTWHSDNRVNHSRPYLTDVIAWRHLPEPYKG